MVNYNTSFFAPNSDSYLAEQEAQPPERQLVAAVLSRAIIDLCHYEYHIRHEAKFWVLFSKDDGDFSFLWCCKILDFNPITIRESLFDSNNKVINSKYDNYYRSIVRIGALSNKRKALNAENYYQRKLRKAKQDADRRNKEALSFYPFSKTYYPIE